MSAPVEGADKRSMVKKLLLGVVLRAERLLTRALNSAVGSVPEAPEIHEDPLVGRFAPRYPPSRPRTKEGPTPTFLKPSTLTVREAYRRGNEILALRGKRSLDERG